jgi:hypothetical protein
MINLSLSVCYTVIKNDSLSAISVVSNMSVTTCCNGTTTMHGGDLSRKGYQRFKIHRLHVSENHDWFVNVPCNGSQK